MNLTKLFEAQAVLDRDIELHHPVEDGEDRLSKKILALLVELGECANEFRGFKFWSNDQEPRTIKKHYADDMGAHFVWKTTNPLLEEYVDCLHFILSIGNDLKMSQHNEVSDFFLAFKSVKHWTVINQFNYTFRQVMKFAETVDKGKPDAFLFTRILRAVLQLGHKLGFNESQIEQAYYDKNKINFERQKRGY
ncbi:dUTP diphosphatase [Viridibacillus arvi]|uniref:dUTP diphosphatase n=1 Tax=Viridibacillus arvi TaxID=263475 RepID=UPI003D27CB65